QGGKLFEELTLKELDEKCRQHLKIKVDDVTKGATVLESDLGLTDFEIMPDGTINLYQHLDDVRRVAKTLTDNGLVIEHFARAGASLELYCAMLVGGGRHE